MSNYLNNLNQIIKINTASISNTESKDAFLLTTKRSRDDLNKVANYINNLLVPALKSLASGPRYTYDAAQIGISGLTLVTYPEAQGNNSSSSPLYWKPGTTLETGRPCTVKESFDFLLGSLVDRIVGVENVAVDLSVITDDIACGGFNLQRVKDDVLGQSYNLNCTSTPSLKWPLAKHLYEIISQLTTGVDQSLIQNMNDGSAYPALTLNLNSTLTLDDLSDVISTGASVGEGLVYNGTNWVPGIIASQEATEEISGTLEVASVSDIAQVLGASDSTSGTSYLAITTEALYGALDADALDGGATNLLRDRVKEVALEQINESSVFELSDVNNPNTLEAKQSLLFDSVSNKFINRRIVWDDIQMRPAVTEPVLYSETQNSSIVNTKQDYAAADKVALLKSHNTLSYKKESGKWEIEKYKSYKGLSPAKSYGVNVFKSSHPLPGYVSKKVPFTVCYAYKNAKHSVSSGNVITVPGVSLPYVQYSSEADEVVSLFNEIKDPSSRVMSSNTAFWEEGSGAVYNLGSEIVGIYRTDKTYLRDEGSYFLNPDNTEKVNFTLYKNSVVDIDIMTEGESLVMVLGPYNCSDKLYACPSYINRRYGLINKEVTFCISESYVNSTDFNDYLIQEELDNIFSGQVLSESNFVGVVTKKYNYNSSVGIRLTLSPPIGVQDFGLNISDSHKLCADLLDIDGNFSSSIQFYEFIDDIWTSKYNASKDYSNATQRSAIAKLTEFSLAYCKLKL